MATKSETKSSTTSNDAGQSQVQHLFAEADKVGYFGTVPDETPNENYTLAGVAAGKKTPESITYRSK